MTSPHTYRAEADRSLAAQLMLDPSVRPILRAFAEREKAQGTRRSLLAQALRLTPAVAPALHATVDRCRTLLEVETEVELYVYPSAQYNAACTAPEGGRVFVLLSSGLAEAFDQDELAFVIGHELGHHVFDHHAIPVPVLAHPDSALPAAVVLRLLSWQRWAEVSCDRAGLVCCGDLTPAASALFKLSSGLSSSPDAARIEAYLDQARDLYAETAQLEGKARNHADWMSSHPFSPVRLSAARAFAESEVLVDGGIGLAELERRVHGFLELMEASYLKEDTTEAEVMRRVLFAGGVVLAGADGEVSRAELDHLNSLLGPGVVPEQPNLDALTADLPKRLSRLKAEVRGARRAQVLHDLAAVARADLRVHDAERALLLAWAEHVGVDAQVVVDALEAPLELD